MKITNLTSPQSGAKVAQQYNLEMNGVDYFQSYDTVIARYKPYYLEVTEDYNYSNTTSKYFRQWLEQWDYNRNEVDNLKKMLSKAKVGEEFELTLDNDSKLVVFYAKEGSFNL